MTLPFFPAEESMMINPIFMPWGHHAAQGNNNPPNMAPVNLDLIIQANAPEQGPPQPPVEEEEEHHP